MNDLAQAYDSQRRRLESFGQQHLLAFWADLNPQQRATLLADLDQIDLERCAPLIDRLVRNRPALHLPGRLEPASVYPAEPRPEQRETYRRAIDAGIAAILAGRVAAFT